MNLAATRKVLEVIESLNGADDKSLNDFINSFSPEESQRLLNDLLAASSPSNYLIKDMIFENDEIRRKVIAPVNAIKFELLNRRANSIPVTLSPDIEKLKKSILEKKTDDFIYLPEDARELIRLHGGGPRDKATEGPFKVWTDNRKFLVPVIMTRQEQKQIKEELEILGRKVVEKLEIDDLTLNYKDPTGSIGNSFNNYCWIAFSLNDSMKDSIHFGMRVYANYFHTSLHIGKNLQDKMKEKDLKFPFEIVDKGDFKVSIFENIEDSIQHLISLKNLCRDLNILFNTGSYAEISSLGPAARDLGSLEYSFKQNIETNTERLQNSTRSRVIEIGAQSLEEKFLYLIKIEGLKYEAREGFLYKIGVTNSPDDRVANLSMGTGARSLLKFQRIFCLQNSGLHERRIKEFLVANTEIYYDGEYFISSMTSEEVKAYIFSIIENE